MTANEKIMQVCAELGLKTYAVAYDRNKRGAPRNFRVTVYDRLLCGGTPRAVIRALRRTFSK